MLYHNMACKVVNKLSEYILSDFPVLRRGCQTEQLLNVRWMIIFYLEINFIMHITDVHHLQKHLSTHKHVKEHEIWALQKQSTQFV